MMVERAHWILLLVLLVGAGSTMPASAQQDDDPETDFVRDGWYLGAQGVWAKEDIDAPPGYSASNDLGFNVRGGYRFLRNLATDLEFEYVDSFAVKPRDSSLRTASYRTFTLAWNFRAYPLARLFAPDSDWHTVQPYLQAAPAWQWVERRRLPGPDQNDGGFAARLGGGIDIYWTDQLLLTTNAVYALATSSDVDDVRFWSVGWGFAWRFYGGVRN